MTRRAQLVVLAVLLLLLVLGIWFPAHTQGDQPQAASRIPASEFVPVRSVGPVPGAPPAPNSSPTPAAPVASVIPSASLRWGASGPDSSPAPQAAQSRAGTPSSATRQSPAASPTMASKLAGVGGSAVVGVASTYGPAFGPEWLALPEGAGVRVTICGPAACIVRVSTDAGPDLAMQRLGRIVDLSVRDFELVSGGSWRLGLVAVTVAR